MSKRLDYKLGFFTKRRSVKGDIGIEVELEGGGNLKLLPSIPKYWKAKPEGSLRNGMEYVLARPTPMSELPAALEEFKLSMDASKPKKTIRCSTHIHVNVLDKTVREVYNILAFYFLVEDLLVKTQGNVRMGNLFCLRMSDAEGMAPSIRRSIESEEYFRHFSMNHFKYGAVNLAAPSKFGSLEFRFLRPITDPDTLKFWCELFYTMIQKASKLSVETTTENVQKLSAKDFLKTVWSEEVVSFLGEYEPFEIMQDSFLTNLDHVLTFSKAMKKVSRQIIPNEFVENDHYEVPDKPISIEALDQVHFEDEEFIPEDEDMGPDDDQPTIQVAAHPNPTLHWTVAIEQANQLQNGQLISTANQGAVGQHTHNLWLTPPLGNDNGNTNF